MMKARMQVQILQRAPFSSFRKELDAIGAPDTNPAQNSEGSEAPRMRFPHTVRHRGQKAVIYRRTEKYPFYRLAHRSAGRRIVRSFSTYSKARV